MWMTSLAVLLSALVAAGPAAQPANGDRVETPIPSNADSETLCVGDGADRLSLSVIRPATTYRLSPSIADIRARGEAFTVVRASPLWKRATRELCVEATKAQAAFSGEFEPRILIELEGRSGGPTFAFEYPRPDQLPSDAVRGQIGDHQVRIKVSDLRYLLDYATSKD